MLICDSAGQKLDSGANVRLSVFFLVLFYCISDKAMTYVEGLVQRLRELLSDDPMLNETRDEKVSMPQCVW